MLFECFSVLSWHELLLFEHFYSVLPILYIYITITNLFCYYYHYYYSHYYHYYHCHFFIIIFINVIIIIIFLMLLTLSVIAFIILFISFCLEIIFKFQTYDVIQDFQIRKISEKHIAQNWQ